MGFLLTILTKFEVVDREEWERNCGVEAHLIEAYISPHL